MLPNDDDFLSDKALPCCKFLESFRRNDQMKPTSDKVFGYETIREDNAANELHLN